MTCFHNKCSLVPWQTVPPLLLENPINSKYTSHVTIASFGPICLFPPHSFSQQKSLRSCVVDRSYWRASLF